MEAHASKSRFKVLVWPAAIVNCPPPIWPDGILIPVFDSLESSRVWTLLSDPSTTQLLSAPHLLPLAFGVAELSCRKTRICWKLPGVSCAPAPSVARKHWLVAAPSRSTCTGVVFSAGV